MQAKEMNCYFAMSNVLANVSFLSIVRLDNVRKRITFGSQRSFEIKLGKVMALVTLQRKVLQQKRLDLPKKGEVGQGGQRGPPGFDCWLWYPPAQKYSKPTTITSTRFKSNV